MVDRTVPTSRACRAASLLGRAVGRALDEGEITPAGYRLLAYLSTGEAAAAVLANKLAVSRPTVSATIDWLEPRGFVVRTPDAVDRRRVRITITEKGAAALASADQLVAHRIGDILDSVNDEETASIVAALDRLHDALTVFRSRGHIGLASSHVPG